MEHLELLKSCLTGHSEPFSAAPPRPREPQAAVVLLKGTKRTQHVASWSVERNIYSFFLVWRGAKKKKVVSLNETQSLFK